MKKRTFPLLCMFALLALVSLTACQQAPEKQEAIPMQGVFSNGIDKEDPLFQTKAVHFSLLDTGKYYIMNAGGEVQEEGQCVIDEEGFGHLRAQQCDPEQAAASGYFLRADHDRYILITGAGEIFSMTQIDSGGRAPAPEDSAA